jgi:predicted 3-demethylubiquinone-9 3-methyltransferase (glyoxalase superfamily)
MTTAQTAPAPAQKITTFLWFDNQAEEAIDFYTSILRNSRKGEVVRYGDTGPGPKGQVMTAEFELAGQRFMALNGGPHFKFTEAISLMVKCDTQEEIDELWEKLSAGGQKVECGWLKDKFGLSWQIVPTILGQLMKDKDPAKRERVMQVIMQTKKFEIAQLQEAAAGK